MTGAAVTDSARRSPRALFWAILVLVAVCLVGAAFLNLIVRRQYEAELQRGRELGTERAHLLERQLDQLQAATAPLAALLAQGMEASEIARLATGILEGSPDLSSIVLAPDGRVTEVYPANAAEIELEFPGATIGAGPRLSDPARLSDGTLVVLGLQPVVMSGSEAGTRQLWGFVAASLRIDRLERTAELGALASEGYDYLLAVPGAASGRQRVVLRSTELDLEEPLRFAVAEHDDTSWVLSLAPRDGWPSWSPYRSHMLLVGVLALVAGLLTWELARQPERLRRQVDQRSHRLRQTRRRLDSERRQRALAEARETWRQLDRCSRLALVTAGRPEEPEGAYEESITRAVAEALEAVGMAFRTEEIRSGIYRLEEMGLLTRDQRDRLRVEKPIILSLPETQKPLVDIANDTLERIGPYRIKRRLGGGGMGEVFQAENVDDGTTAAVKLLYPQALEDREQRQRFEREGTIVARLDHPNVVRLLARGDHLNRLYIAMELIEGESLEALIRSRGPLAESEALAILWDVAQALAALHSLGVVHRDIKSSNVMRRAATGQAILLDFGLARRMTSQALTRSDTLLGTVPYMAPERLGGTRGTTRIDIWAAGLLLYEMLAGRLPWNHPEQLTLVKEILSTYELPIRKDLRGLASPAILRLLEDMLAYAPEDRLHDGNAVVARLAAITGWSPGSDSGEWKDLAPPTGPENPPEQPPEQPSEPTVPWSPNEALVDSAAISLPRRRDKS